MTEPASIRFKNPGAMWGNALAIKWGAARKAVILHDGKGQGNNIAVFPSFVQGICAQLDLWRTSKNYRNKRFEDAIAIWSGHNEVESYIAFVLKRVPGMTRKTVMNDTFWRSSKGIAFLKAQAWHEAGKRYPAPDADWIEAQRRVFEGETVSEPVIPVSPTVAETGDPALRSVQMRLKSLNYSPGAIDGDWGSGTTGALAGFLNDRGGLIPVPFSLEAFHEARDEIGAELGKAEGEGWTRPVNAARKEASIKTVTEVAPEVVPAKRSFLAALWGSILAFFTAVWNTLSGYVEQAWNFFTDHKDDVPDAPGMMSTVWTYLGHVPGAVWLAMAGIGLAFVALEARKSVKKITEQVQTGARQ